MNLDIVTRAVYVLLGVLYICIGVGSMLLPTGWLPWDLAPEVLGAEKPPPQVEHLVQEFGTVVIALGVVFLGYSARKEQSRVFHWTMTIYFALDALIHWVGPDGIIGAWPRGIINSIPFAVMLLLGVLQYSRQRAVDRS